MESDSATVLFFPVGFNFQNVWKHNVQAIIDGRERGNWAQVEQSVMFFDTCLEMRVIAMSRDCVDLLIPALIDLILDSAIIVRKRLQDLACGIIVGLWEWLLHHGPGTTRITFDRMFNWYKECLKTTLMDDTDAMTASEATSQFLACARLFYGKDQGLKAFDVFKDRVGCADDRTRLLISNMLLFVSYWSLPDVIDPLMSIIDEFVNLELVGSVLEYFSSSVLAFPFVGYEVDWKPYI